MSQERLINRILHSYADCLVLDDGEIDYEESCYRISCRIKETLSETQQDSIFGTPFNDQQDCFDYIVKKIPGLCEGMIEFAEENDLK
jgi:hypothetical protein